MTESRTIAPNQDPVCGMGVDVEKARANGLSFTYEEREYVFCGKGCLLEFRDNPEQYLEASFTPEM